MNAPTIEVPPELSGKKFKVILCDPPWTYTDKCNAGERGAGFKYSTMTLPELYALRSFIDAIAAPDCLLALWHVAPMPLEALMLVSKWGFKLKTMKGFTWVKTTASGKEFFGMGNWSRANSEDCLFAVRGKPKRVDASVRQLITAPRREHSRKPDEARDRLVKLMGDVPRLEMFARQPTPGWSVFGNETEKFAA